MSEAIDLTKAKGNIRKEINHLLNGANLNLCLTCGTCSGGCPATGQIGHGPEKTAQNDCFWSG